MLGIIEIAFIIVVLVLVAPTKHGKWRNKKAFKRNLL